MTAPRADETYGLAHGYAPIAHKVLCIDYDGTLYPWDEIHAEPPPNRWAVKSVRRFVRAGFRVIIFTSRLSPTWLAKSGLSADDEHAYIERMLQRDGIPFDDITSEKVPAEFYIDDRAIRFRDNWQEIGDFILWETTK